MEPSVDDILRRLAGGETLAPAEMKTLVTAPAGPGGGDAIAAMARAAALRCHGSRVLVRGLLEVGNRCRRDCLYCGIRRSNASASRYRLTPDEMLEACRDARALGFSTLVLQGGEWPEADGEIARVVEAIHSEMPSCAITLSLGERPAEVYAMWRRAGASRYLLRHETASPRHYATLHPADMDLGSRIDCLRSLKALGYQTGAGMMIGSPGQTADHLVADLMLLQELRPEMVGMGPFVPHSSTPFASHPAGSVEMTLRMIAITRIMLPYANIPSTTALATVHPRGRELGILAGANVVMPNITPLRFRPDYSLYDNKASLGAEAAEGLDLLARSLESIGMTLDMSRGDFSIPTDN